MRVTETTPLLGQPSFSRPRHGQVNNSPGEPSDIFCPHPSSHRLHIKLTLAQRAKKDRQTPSYERLSVIQEEDEETVSQSEEVDDSISGLSSSNGGIENSDEESYGSIQGPSSSNGGTDDSDEELDTSEEQAVYQPVMVPIVVQPMHTQTLEEEDTWEVGCVSSMCWPLMWLFQKLDTAPDDQDDPRPAPLSEETEDSDAELADDEYSSSTESSGSSSTPSTFSPHLELLMPVVRVFGQSGLGLRRTASFWPNSSQGAIVEFRRLLFSDERVLEFRL